MNRKKLILCVLLTMFLAYGSVASTYAYFTANKTVSDNIEVELGDIEAKFIPSANNSENRVIDISGMLPGDVKEISFKIKNTATLTSKIAVGFSEFSEDISSTLLSKLSCRIVIESNDVTYNLGEWANKPIQLKDTSGKPMFLAPNGEINGKIIITLDENTPYSEQNKTLNFNLNIIASQPNDADWHVIK